MLLTTGERALRKIGQRDVGTLGGASSSATVINDLGQITGQERRQVVLCTRPSGRHSRRAHRLTTRGGKQVVLLMVVAKSGKDRNRLGLSRTQECGRITTCGREVQGIILHCQTI